jgi:SAM-dependent methyltransferase
MTEAIDQTSYWAERLANARARGEIHHAVFICSEEQWKGIERKHVEILGKHVKHTDSVLDAGCGYGRLLDMLPKGWQGGYLGIDLSPDFIHMARDKHPHKVFICGDLRNLPDHIPPKAFDWAVLISIKNMVIGQMGTGVWEQIEAELKTVAKRLLILEYNENEREVVYEVS